MRYSFNNDTLVFQLSPLEAVVALKSQLQIKKSSIVSIEWRRTFKDWPDMLLRMPGSYMPHVVLAGSYWTGSYWDFIYAKNPRGILKPTLKNILVITTNKKRYRRYIIEAIEIDAQEIKQWFDELSNDHS